MITKAAAIDFGQRVRKIYSDETYVVTNVTFGPGTYIVDINFEYGCPQCHVLVGRYSSIGHRINFVLGLNHDSHRVSTYPFKEAYSGVSNKGVNGYKHVNHHQIVIGNDVWIGAGATILSGVKIGNGAVIGADAVVAKDIPPYAVVVGNPAKVIKYRFDSDTIAWLQKLRWWNWDAEYIRNHWQEMDDMQSFKEKYANYIEEPKNTKYCQELKKAISDFKSAGYNFYYFIPDLDSNERIWKYVLEKFSRDDTVNGKKLLYVDIMGKVNNAIYDEFMHGVEAVQQGQLVLNMPSDEYDFKAVLPLMDYIITTKEDESSRIVDYASGCNAKIVYGFDEFM